MSRGWSLEEAFPFPPSFPLPPLFIFPFSLFPLSFSSLSFSPSLLLTFLLHPFLSPSQRLPQPTPLSVLIFREDLSSKDHFELFQMRFFPAQTQTLLLVFVWLGSETSETLAITGRHRHSLLFECLQTRGSPAPQACCADSEISEVRPCLSCLSRRRRNMLCEPGDVSVSLLLAHWSLIGTGAQTPALLRVKEVAGCLDHVPISKPSPCFWVELSTYLGPPWR